MNKLENKIDIGSQQYIDPRESLLGDMISISVESTVVSPEKEAEILQEIMISNQLLTELDKPYLLSGGCGIALSGNGKLERDQNDVDFEMYKDDSPTFIEFINNKGYRCFDPETKKWAFSGKKKPRKLNVIKTQKNAPGPEYMEVYFMEKHDRIVKSAFYDLSIPASYYDNPQATLLPDNTSIPTSPLEVQMLYKYCLLNSTVQTRQEDAYDFARYLPRLTPPQLNRFLYLTRTAGVEFLNIQAQRT